MAPTGPACALAANPAKTAWLEFDAPSAAQVGPPRRADTTVSKTAAPPCQERNFRLLDRDMKPVYGYGYT